MYEYEQWDTNTHRHIPCIDRILILNDPKLNGMNIAIILFLCFIELYVCKRNGEWLVVSEFVEYIGR